MRQPNPQATYAQKRCALTAQLRYRAQAAEAEARRARAEADAAIAKAEAREEAAQARVSELYGRIEAERAALTAHMESPEWERDLLVVARDRVRSELLSLSAANRNCQSCGSFGRKFQAAFLQGDIDRLTDEHGLPPVQPLPAPDWPTRMGAVMKGGRSLDGSWFAKDPPKPPPEREGLW